MSEQTFELWEPQGCQLQSPEGLEVRWSANDGLQIGVADGLSGAVCLWIAFTLDRAFQCIDEGYRLRSLPTQRGIIWRVQDSEYIREFRRSAAGTMDSFPLIHWLVVSGNQCVDVLSESAPVLRFTDAQQSAAGDARDARA